MRDYGCLTRKGALFLALSALVGVLAVAAMGQSAIKVRGEGMLDYVEGGTSTFVMAGTASHLGVFQAEGEIDYVAGEDGSLDGAGFASFTAANGDVLAAVVTDHVDSAGNGDIHFSWRDSVELAGGTVESTGRFADTRPPGLIIRYEKICILTICFIIIK
jgi:hypothetical protein